MSSNVVYIMICIGAILIALSITALIYKMIFRVMKNCMLNSICIENNTILIAVNKSNEIETMTFLTDEIRSFNFRFGYYKLNQLPNLSAFDKAPYYNVEFFINFNDGHNSNIKLKMPKSLMTSFILLCKSLTDKKLISKDVIDDGFTNIISNLKGLKKFFLFYLVIAAIICILVLFL